MSQQLPFHWGPGAFRVPPVEPPLVATHKIKASSQCKTLEELMAFLVPPVPPTLPVVTNHPPPRERPRRGLELGDDESSLR